MGASQSSAAHGEQVIAPSASVQFSPALIDSLSSRHEPVPPSSSADDIIRRRLAAEAAHIRSQEAEILHSISAALEKENLDKDKAGLNSDVLGRDIEEIREKIERIRENKNREEEGVRLAREGVKQCYLDHPDKPLDCWKQVDIFKTEVSKLEQAFVKSLQ
nr:hypothetical protein L204_02384 [Cryptococcus depauperatus CBS 7855]